MDPKTLLLLQMHRHRLESPVKVAVLKEELNGLDNYEEVKCQVNI